VLPIDPPDISEQLQTGSLETKNRTHDTSGISNFKFEISDGSPSFFASGMLDLEEEDMIDFIRPPSCASTGSAATHPIRNEETRLPWEDQERRLLNSLSDGKSSAFWPLWQRYQDYLYGLCLRFMRGNQVEAEDALSQAMIKAFEQLPSRAGSITALQAWFTRLVRNVCVDAHRKHQRGAYHLQSLEELSLSADTRGRLAFESPEETILRHEMYACLRAAIENLPPRLRRPSILRFLEDQPYQDIAQCLALSPENVRKCIQEARVILHKQLNKYLVDGLAPKAAANGSAIPAGDEPFSEPRSFPPEVNEVKVEVSATRVVQVTLPSGVEMSFHVFLSRRPTRLHLRIKTLSKYVQHHPRGWKKRLELAELLFAVGQWEGAVQQYYQALEKQPRMVSVWLKLANLLHVMERPDEATAVCESACAWARHPATQYHLSGMVALGRQHYDVAVRAFEAAAALDFGNVAHWQALGSAHLRAHNPRAAAQAFDQALKLNPDDLVALTRSYEALQALGDVEEALLQVQRLLAIAPDDVLALTRMADHHLRWRWVQGEAGACTRHLIRRALQLAPEAADVQELLARYYLLRGEREKGLNVLRTFSQQHPRSAQGWFHYARWLFHVGERLAAAEAIMRASALRPDDREIHRAARHILTLGSRPTTSPGVRAPRESEAARGGIAGDLSSEPIQPNYPLSYWSVSVPLPSSCNA
jgi:RNA polymerase sigma factor (sigma-70 family)